MIEPIQILSVAGGFAMMLAIFASGYFGEQARILELEPAIVGGAL